jgi:hypothetical protein
MSRRVRLALTGEGKYRGYKLRFCVRMLTASTIRLRRLNEKNVPDLAAPIGYPDDFDMDRLRQVAGYRHKKIAGPMDPHSNRECFRSSI